MIYLNSKLHLITPFLLSLIVACQGDNLNADIHDSAVIETSSTQVISLNSGTDITNAIFVATSADCANYADAYFSQVMDVDRRIEFDGKLDIVVSEDSCTLISNNIPNHNFNDGAQPFANNVAEVEKRLVISRTPQLADTTTALSQGFWDAVMLNGVVVDRLSAGCWDDTRETNVPAGCDARRAKWLIDPIGSNGFFNEDSHNAHAQPDGSYHYHSNPNAMFDDNPGPNRSPVIGFAADGFPIYGPYFIDPTTGEVRKAKSGYTLKDGTRPDGPGGEYDGFYVQDWEFTDSGDLDACNGMMVGDRYGYYVTDTYPWIIECFRGKPHESFQK
ncbi:MAG: YHYH protein [Cyanobacteria bacterium P01_H01_bin.15]